MASQGKTQGKTPGKSSRKAVGHSKDTSCSKKPIDNYFCTVKLDGTALKVIIYLPENDSLGQVILKQCRDADYNCCLVHKENKVIENLSEIGHQALVLVNVEATTSLPGSSAKQNSFDRLSKYINEQGLDQFVGIIGLVKDLSSSALMSRLMQKGISRVLTYEESRSTRLLLELKMAEKSEVALRSKCIFGQALYEAVSQSNDAIQVTGKDSRILYVNRSFLDLSGYTSEEVIGQPAWDILRPEDSKPDNGPKVAVRNGQGWDGICKGRRKSGSVLRQHLKVIPVRGAADHVNHHVTIQRLLSVHDSDHHPRFSPRVHDIPDLLKKQPSLSKLLPRLESPLLKAVQMLNSAKDNPSTPQNVKEELEKAIDALSNSELYRVPSSGRSGGIVEGLLQRGLGKYSQSKLNFKSSHSTTNLSSVPISPIPSDVQKALKNLDQWDFDIINMETVSKHRPLYYVGMKIFSEFDICSVLDIKVGVLSSWFKLMEDHYHKNPYHNSTHAADVLQATAYFVKLLQDNLVLQGDMLDRSEVAALLITAVIHDLDHPGRTNPYLCNTRHELAILYNDNAVLENHHVALCFTLTGQSDDVNIFQSLNEAAFRSLRRSIIDLVLATDMAKHFEHLTKFNMTVVDGETGSQTVLSKEDFSENRMIMKRILVKCADISNPSRPLSLCKIWAQRISEEYFSQTEDEKQRNLPVVFPDFDRQTCVLPVTQVKFMDFFISGLFDAWNAFCPIPTLMDQLKTNYSYWKGLCPDSPNYSEEEPDPTSS